MLLLRQRILNMTVATSTALRMKVSAFVSAAALLSGIVAATPKLLICSDSTTANYANGSVLQG